MDSPCDRVSLRSVASSLKKGRGTTKRRVEEVGLATMSERSPTEVVGAGKKEREVRG